MDYTREPIVETVVTPRDGCKLAVRNSKGAGTEEFFVDALEVVSFGNSFFFRSIERPKSFLLPVTDYEVIEVREPRLALKHGGVDRSIKIGGGKESSKGSSKESTKESSDSDTPMPVEPKKRERRRHHRRRRGAAEEKDLEQAAEEQTEEAPKEKKEGRSSRSKGSKKAEAKQEAKAESKAKEKDTASEDKEAAPSLAIQPPPQLISETMERYRQSEEYSEAFYKEGEADSESEPMSGSSEEAGESPERFRSEAQEQEQGGSSELEENVGEVRQSLEGVELANEQVLTEEHVEERASSEEELAQATRRLSFLDIMEEMSDPRS